MDAGENHSQGSSEGTWNIQQQLLSACGTEAETGSLKRSVILGYVPKVKLEVLGLFTGRISAFSKGRGFGSP